MSVKVILRSIKFTFGASVAVFDTHHSRTWKVTLVGARLVPTVGIFDECENKNLRRRRPLRAENFLKRTRKKCET